jgi:hypothetical protein
VVLKGPSIKHRKSTAEQVAQQQQQRAVQQQQQQQQQLYSGPRSQGTLSEMSYPRFPPTTASLLLRAAVPAIPGTACPGMTALHEQAVNVNPQSANSVDMQQQQQQQQQQADSRPSTNGSSKGGSRRSSNHDSRRSSSSGQSTRNRGNAFDAAPLQVPQQQSGEGRYAWPPMPDSARMQQGSSG